LSLLNGCATPYQSEGFRGGYSDTQLAPDVFRITFKGNAYISKERTQDFALLRAAELTQQFGFKYFAIVDELSSTDVSTFTTPGSEDISGSVNIYGGPSSYHGIYSGHKTYIPPKTHFIIKPRTGLLIQCFTDKPDGIYAFDASFLQKSLKQKYKIE